MSADAMDAISHILRDTLARNAAATSAAKSCAILNEHLAATARQSADHVELKIRTEAGWTPRLADGLKQHVFDLIGSAVTETFDAFGLSKIAPSAVAAASEAYIERLAEIENAPPFNVTGGAA